MMIEPMTCPVIDKPVVANAPIFAIQKLVKNTRTKPKIPALYKGKGNPFRLIFSLMKSLIKKSRLAGLKSISAALTYTAAA